MPAKSLDPLKKVTVDLFARDVDYLRQRSFNFSDVVRNAVNDYVRKCRVVDSHNEMRRSLKDLPNAR